MTNQQIVNGLKQLGFDSGWVISGDEIVIWENNAPQPTESELLEASDLWDAKQAEREAVQAAKRQALLDKLGITEEEAKLLLG